MNKLILDNFMSKFSADVGIDLGTSNTPIVVKGTGVRLREPSFVAMDIKKKKVVAIGHEAKVMYGRNHNNIQIIRPVKDGVIGNFEIASSLIEYLLRRVKHYGLFRPRVMIGVPTDISEVERRAVQEAARIGGARLVYLIDQPFAAAIGADLPVLESRGNMILDIGGGTSEVSVISLGGIVMSRSIKTAGEKMDEAVQAMVRKKFNLLIGELTAEELKTAIGSARHSNKTVRKLIKGRDLATGMPKAIYVDSEDVYESIKDCINTIIELVKNCLELTPPELMGDIIDNGLVVTGGLSHLEGMEKALSTSLNLKCWTPPDPSFSVARGIEKIFKDQRLIMAALKSRKYRQAYESSNVE